MFCEYKKFPFWIIKFPRKDRSLSQNVIDLQNCTPPKTIRHIRRFLGMLNVYRRFIPQAASQQAPLHNLLSGPKVKATTLITWTSELHAAFQSCKEASPMLPSSPIHTPQLHLRWLRMPPLRQWATSYSNLSGSWQPLEFFSRKLTPTHQNTARMTANC